jgi:hypothetical protein
MTRLAAVVVAGLLLVAPQTGLAQEEGEYQIKNRRTEKLLAVNAGSKDAGAKVIQDTPKKGAGLKWKLVKVGQDFKIVNVNSGKVLTCPKLTKDPASALVTIENDTGGKNQLWALDKREIKGTAFYVIKSRSQEDLVLDVDNAQTNPGAFVIVYGLSLAKEGTAQLWSLEPAK